MIHLPMHGFFLSQPSPDKIGDRMKGYASWLKVDFDNIDHNLDEIQERTKAEVMPCVKNNAYGHGLMPVFAYLSEKVVGGSWSRSSGRQFKSGTP